MAKEFGDFQTPLPLVTMILSRLQRDGISWARVIEPTCGQGNFIAGLLDQEIAPRELYAFELQASYVEAAQKVVDERVGLVTRTLISQRNIFDVDLRRELKWTTQGQLLVLGNPPWVTNAALGVLDSQNLPLKTNIKRMRGLEALTGSANFYIGEAILLKLIAQLADDQPVIAMLCKTSVARNVLQFIHQKNIPFSRAALWRIDSPRWFHAAVEACLFVLDRLSQSRHAYL